MCLFQTAYNQRDPVHSFLRQLMALPFLPAEHITDTFLRLDQKQQPRSPARPRLHISHTYQEPRLPCSVLVGLQDILFVKKSE